MFLQEDPEFQEIDELLIFYDRKIKEWHIRKNHSGNRFVFAEKNPYPFKDRDYYGLVDLIDAYVRSFDEPQQAKANGWLLFKFIPYLQKSFAKHAEKLINKSVKYYPLKDKDKVNALEYILSMDKLSRFDENFLMKITDFDLSQKDMSRRLSRKIAEKLNSGRKRDKFKFFYDLFTRFAQHTPALDNEDVRAFSGLYFALADKAVTPLFLAPLVNLAENVGCSEDKIRSAVVVVFAAYHDHVAVSHKFNQDLHDKMFAWAKTFQNMDRYSFQQKDFDALTAALTPSADAKKSGKKFEALRKMAVELSSDYVGCYQYQNPLKKSQPLKPDNRLVSDYADYLFERAYFNTREELKTDRLLALLRANATFKGISVKQADLFGSKTEITPIVDKKMALEVAKKWAASVEVIDEKYGDYNAYFGGQMQKMFQEIVTTTPYAPCEVKQLTDIIATGAHGNKVFKDIAASVQKAYFEQKAKPLSLYAGRNPRL